MLLNIRGCQRFLKLLLKTSESQLKQVKVNCNFLVFPLPHIPTSLNDEFCVLDREVDFNRMFIPAPNQASQSSLQRRRWRQETRKIIARARIHRAKNFFFPQSTMEDQDYKLSFTMHVAN